MRARLRALLRDTRGQADLAPMLLAQIPFWFLVTLIVVVALAGLKQAGTASLAHLAARRAGTATLAAGQALASEKGAVWHVPGNAAEFSADAAHRAVLVDWDFGWQSETLAGRILARIFRLRNLTLLRREAFYAGPPDDWE